MLKRREMPRTVGALEWEVEVVELCWERGRNTKVCLSKTSSTQVAPWYHLGTLGGPMPTPLPK